MDVFVVLGSGNEHDKNIAFVSGIYTELSVAQAAADDLREVQNLSEEYIREGFIVEQDDSGIWRTFDYEDYAVDKAVTAASVPYKCADVVEVIKLPLDAALLNRAEVVRSGSNKD